MRLHFQERPYDLAIIAAATAVMSGILLAVGVGNIAAILLFLFAPGYMVVAVVFPGRDGLDWIERLALSAGLGLALVPILALVLSFTSFGIGLSSLVIFLLAFTLAMGGVAAWRRLALEVGQRLQFTTDLRGPGDSQDGPVERALAIAMAGSVIFAGAAFAYVILAPRPGEGFTEFFLLGPNGTAGGYPETLNVSEPASVTMVVLNHEAAKVSYLVQVDLVGVRTVLNGTTGRNETIEVNRTSRGVLAFSLDDGQAWIRPYPFTIDNAGNWRIDFHLFRSSDPATTYRDLHLFVAVG